MSTQGIRNPCVFASLRLCVKNLLNRYGEEGLVGRVAGARDANGVERALFQVQFGITLFLDLKASSSRYAPADCQSATQQVANLRYEEVAPGEWCGLISKTFNIQHSTPNIQGMCEFSALGKLNVEC